MAVDPHGTWFASHVYLTHSLDSSLVGVGVALSVPVPEVPIDGVLVGELWSPGLVWDCDGDSLGDADSLGLCEGDSLGDCEGDSLGLSEGDSLGDSLGLSDGDADSGLLCELVAVPVTGALGDSGGRF